MLVTRATDFANAFGALRTSWTVAIVNSAPTTADTTSSLHGWRGRRPTVVDIYKRIPGRLSLTWNEPAARSERAIEHMRNEEARLRSRLFSVRSYSLGDRIDIIGARRYDEPTMKIIIKVTTTTECYQTDHVVEIVRIRELGDSVLAPLETVLARGTPGINGHECRTGSACKHLRSAAAGALALLEADCADAKKLLEQMLHTPDAIVQPIVGAVYELTVAEKDLVRSNDIIAAIKSIRARTTLGLKEAKDLVDAYRDHTSALALTRVEKDLVGSRYADAVKTVRARLGIPLKDARTIVDAYRSWVGL